MWHFLRIGLDPARCRLISSSLSWESTISTTSLIGDLNKAGRVVVNAWLVELKSKRASGALCYAAEARLIKRDGIGCLKHAELGRADADSSTVMERSGFAVVGMRGAVVDLMSGVGAAFHTAVYDLAALAAESHLIWATVGNEALAVTRA